MEDTETAKFIVGTLLGHTVVSIDAKAQEMTYTSADKDESKEKEEGNEKKPSSVVYIMRLDFIATIQTEAGEYKKVLIEMQKALSMVDIIRFRDYLGEQYKRRDIVDGQAEVLPIIPIYIIADKLPNINTACVRVNRSYYDVIHEKYINERDAFIERLSHDCIVVQTLRVDSDRYATNLDKLLSVFEQKHFVYKEIDKDYPYKIDNDNIRRIIDILHYCASDAAERQKIEYEAEAWRVYELAREELLQELKKEKEDKQRIIAEKDTVIAEKDTVIAEKEAALIREQEEKVRILAEKEAALIREQEEKAEKARILAEKEALLAELNALRNKK
jgi:hypothetical protein